MRIFGPPLPELIIILVVILLIFGPGLFKKLNKQLKKTGEAAKKGIEAVSAEAAEAWKAAGKKVDLDNVSKDDILDKVENLQDKMDVKLDEFNSEMDKVESESKQDDKPAAK